MAIVRCPNKHYYNDEQYSSCPHCGVKPLFNNSSGNFASTTIPKDHMPKSANNDDGVTIAKYKHSTADKSSHIDNEPKTVGIYSKKDIGNPVVGWLVCSEGSNKGRDYRIYSGYNRAGRDPSSDICIYNDPNIELTSHFIIAYDPKGNMFHLIPGSNTLVLLNNKSLLSPTPLNAYDTITAGNTSLKFIPYCKGDVRW